MKKIIVLIFALFLIGCKSEVFYFNNTMIINNTEKYYYTNLTIKEVIKEIPSVCPECNNTMPKAFQERLNKCYIRLDYLNNEYYDCLTSNTSKYSESITFELKKCYQELNTTKDKLEQIKNI